MAREDRTEAPTPKRLREARKKGQIAKSAELGTWATVLLATLLLPQLLGGVGGRLRGLFVRTGEAIADPSQSAAKDLVATGGRTVLATVLPLALAMLAGGVLVALAQTRGTMATQRLRPDPKRLNPIAGFKRLFSVDSAWSTVRVLARTGIMAFAASFPLRTAIERLASAEQPPLPTLVAAAGRDAVTLVRVVSFAGLLLGLVDYAVSWRRTAQSIRMTKQEVKEEHRRSEGDPLVKGKIREKQRQVSRNRMLAAIADASVIVVNPTHVAVALRYDGTGAPRVVAKGKGELARRIRELAEEHRVPIVRDVALAWALHDTCPLDHPIPEELYGAVAKVLAFVMTVGKRAAAIGGVLSLPAAT